MEWLNAAFSVAGGGIFGLIGAGVNKFFDYKKQQQINIQELAMADKVAVQMDKDSDNDAKGLMSAIEAEQSIKEVHKWVNDVRGMTRPVLTLILVLMAWWEEGIDKSLDWMASTAVTFWFGDRPPKKR